MKILQVIPYFNWSYGGPVKVVYDLAYKLTANGHDVSIYTTNVGLTSSLDKKHEIESDLFDIKYFNCFNNYLANNFKLHISSEMKKELKTNLNEFDVIHLHEWRGIPNLYVWYYAKKFNIPYIIQAHGASPLVLGNQKSFLTISKLLFDKLFCDKIVNDAFKLIALSEAEFSQYINFGCNENKIEIIPNGVDLPIIVNTGNFRSKYDIEDNEYVILFLGRINQNKGIELLLNAFSRLLTDLKDVKLVIVGPDDGFLKYAKFKSKNLNINDKTIFTGPLYGKDKMEAYVNSDIFVLPSVYETFPLSVLEAFAFNKPVIVTKNCGISDLISNAGLIVDYDEYELSEAMKELLTNSRLKIILKRNIKNLLQTHFNWNEIIKKYESLYRKSIN